MKKILVLLLFVASLSTTIMAQIEKPVVIMPQAGINLSRFASEPNDIEYGMRTGFHAGLFIRTNRTVFIQPGIFYSRQGNDLYHYSEINANSLRDNVDYNMLKIPVFFGLKIWHLRLYTGPTVSFLTNVYGNDFGFDRDDFSWAVLGMNLGAGFHIGVFSLDCHYEFGLTQVSPVIANKTNVLSINAGFHIAL